ncbi:MAG TPA: tRNA threonylcarbamoyladenosine dehydratase [Spirochaetota bacterium]|nr:tRNA threonylcarbamoyladenosine dehydratase [Spirochaetota bacterium]
MMDLSRSRILIGDERLLRLKESTVAVFGLGGVGGYAAEAIVRAGVGRLLIDDFDVFTPSNINRQLLALQPCMGRLKTDVADERYMQINPELEIIKITEHLTPENIPSIIPDGANNFYAIDAIDEIAAKTALIAELHRRAIPFVSSMGAGSRLDPSQVKTADISKTSHCPLARVIRRNLKDLGIERGVRCVYSTENLNRVEEPETGNGRRTQGSISFMPGIFGLTLAGIIINDIITRDGKNHG